MESQKLRGRVYCEECKSDLIIVDNQEDYWQLVSQLEAGLLTCHATAPHSSNHKMWTEIRCDGPPGILVGQGRDLKITCLRCIPTVNRNNPMELKNVPTWLVNSAALSFHTCHEGHPMEIQYGDWVISSPVKK